MQDQLIWVMITMMVLLPKKLHSQSFDSTIFEFNTFAGFGLEPDLIYQGDAHTTQVTRNGSIVPFDQRFLRLTRTGTSSAGWPNPGGLSVGRLLYSPLIRLWNDAERRRASFQTVIRGHIGNPFSGTLRNNTIGDGISFFIATVANTSIPSESVGGNMGLYQSSGVSAVKLVAVELDTYANAWDPQYPHLGFNSNGRTSAVVDRWDFGGWPSDFELRITFDPDRSVLSVAADARPTEGPNVTARMEVAFDAKTFLSEWVQIGLSATTGLTAALHEIHHWSFFSFMQSDHLTLQPQDS